MQCDGVSGLQRPGYELPVESLLPASNRILRCGPYRNALIIGVGSASFPWLLK